MTLNTLKNTMKSIVIRSYLFFALLLTVGCSQKTSTYAVKQVEKDTLQIVEIGGCHGVEYDDWETSEYVLPYPVGRGYRTNLSHCGGSYHSEGQPDQFAIDFATPIGSEITASRAGTVVFIEESGKDGGFPNNKVVLVHADGTFTQYMHLTENGALVRVGDKLEQGDLLGLSGNTGLAGYAHLHFVATKSGDFNYPYESIPTTFNNTDPNPRSLLSNKYYRAKSY